MARPEEFNFTAHCCGNEEIELECKVCPVGLPIDTSLRVSNGEAEAIFQAIADHVHRDPTAKPCHRVIQHRKALEV